MDVVTLGVLTHCQRGKRGALLEKKIKRGRTAANQNQQAGVHGLCSFLDTDKVKESSFLSSILTSNI